MIIRDWDDRDIKQNIIPITAASAVEFYMRAVSDPFPEGFQKHYKIFCSFEEGFPGIKVEDA
jgi:hypothetical protein